MKEASVARKKTTLVVCPQCGKHMLEAEMEGGRCRWCVLQAKVKAWLDWREARQR